MLVNKWLMVAIKMFAFEWFEQSNGFIHLVLVTIKEKSEKRRWWKEASCKKG